MPSEDQQQRERQPAPPGLHAGEGTKTSTASRFRTRLKSAMQDHRDRDDEPRELDLADQVLPVQDDVTDRAVASEKNVNSTMPVSRIAG